MTLAEMLKRERREVQCKNKESAISLLIEKGWSRSDAEAFAQQMIEHANFITSDSYSLRTMNSES